jgi:lipopolysaccharide biosynthesis glycosyltransferase
MQESQKKIYNLNAKLPIENKEMLEEIVEFYRSKIEIGKVSISDVIQNLIKTKYEEIQNKK